MPLETDIAQLRERLREVDDLRSAASLLSWDQSTYMPRGGAIARGRHLATLGRLAHERLIDPELRHLLDRLLAADVGLGPAEHDLVRVAAHDAERAARFPSAFLAAFTEHTVASYEAWTRAREANEFGIIAPLLERTLDYSREYASYVPGVAHPADALIDVADEGMTVAALRPLFARLRAGLLPLLERVAGAADATTANETAASAALPVQGPPERQLALAQRFAAAIGYDLARGRQDLTPHPFAIRMAHGDVRITTRVDPHDLSEALFSTLHEAGHALYEQGIAAELDGTLLASGVSAGVHESQSRLWENLVARSHAFWRFALPIVQRDFPELAALSVDDAYRAVNQVRRSLVRTEADELTYNLHVIVRFELELELLEGGVSVRDLPEAWSERYVRDLGVRPQGVADGVLQDVHWFAGPIGGAFQGYTIGNVLSVQCFEAAAAAIGDADAQFAAGDFAPLHAWLQGNVYAWGRRLSPTALIEHVTGGPLRVEPYLAYLERKYLDPRLLVAA